MRETKSSFEPMPFRWLCIRCLFLACALCVGAALTGCKTDDEPENADTKPWNTPKSWEHGLPSGMWERPR